MKLKYLGFVMLVAYIFLAIYLAVMSRDIVYSMNPVRLDLFKCYYQPEVNSYRDIYVNIVCFIPIGMLAGLLIERYRLVKVLLVGLLVSLTIEFSQLIWHRGVFDVDDLFNNTLGAVIGGVIVFETFMLCSLAKAR